MYEILDVIADSYIPVLAGIFLLKCVTLIFRGGWGSVTGGIKVLFGLLIVSYGFMALDQYFRVFERFSLDYSTHTAVAFSGVVAIYALSRRVLYLLLISYLSYVFLMLYQQYHTLEDILATLVLIVPFFYLCFYVALGHGFCSKKACP